MSSGPDGRPVTAFYPMTQLPDGTLAHQRLLSAGAGRTPGLIQLGKFRHDRVSPKVLALLGALTLVWGTNWPLFKIALDELPVLTFRSHRAGHRDPHAAAILLVRGESFAVPRGKWPALIAASAMNIFVWNIATSLAVLYIPSGHASVLAYTMPLWVALIGFAVFGQRLTGRLLAAILIGAAAVVALMVPNFASYAQAPAGPVLGPVRGLLLGGRHLHRQAHELARHGPVAHLLAGRDQPAADPAGRPGDRRPADALAVDPGAGRHDLHRRRSHGAGHRRLVRPGEAVARPGRRRSRPSPSRSWPS